MWGGNISCSAASQEESKKTCSPRKAFSAVLSLSLIVKVLGSFNRKPPYCSVSAVVVPLASVCVAVASRMFSPLSFLFFSGGGGFQWQLAAVASSLLSQVKGR